MSYPAWICHPCGAAHGRVYKDRLSTYHEPDKADSRDACGWCGTQERPLTEPRDYGYPKAPGARMIW